MFSSTEEKAGQLLSMREGSRRPSASASAASQAFFAATMASSREKLGHSRTTTVFSGRSIDWTCSGTVTPLPSSYTTDKSPRAANSFSASAAFFASALDANFAPMASHFFSFASASFCCRRCSSLAASSACRCCSSSCLFLSSSCLFLSCLVLLSFSCLFFSSLPLSFVVLLPLLFFFLPVTFVFRVRFAPNVGLVREPLQEVSQQPAWVGVGQFLQALLSQRNILPFEFIHVVEPIVFHSLVYCGRTKKTLAFFFGHLCAVGGLENKRCCKEKDRTYFGNTEE